MSAALAMLPANIFFYFSPKKEIISNQRRSPALKGRTPSLCYSESFLSTADAIASMNSGCELGISGR